MSQSRQIICLEKDDSSVRKKDIPGVNRFHVVVGTGIQYQSEMVRYCVTLQPACILQFDFAIASSCCHRVPASVSAPASIDLFLMNHCYWVHTASNLSFEH